MPKTPQWSDEAAVVVIGGGVIGASIAYHLCRAGVTDVLLLERNELSSGATARSAGLLSHARSDPTTTRMISRTRAAIGELEAIRGESLGFRQVGSIRAVETERGEQELRHMEACLVEAGGAPELLDAHQARDLCPWLELGDARRILFVPWDGYVDAARLGVAYARAAASFGARVRRGTQATGLVRQGGVVLGVTIEGGAIRAGEVVVAGGPWAAGIAAWTGFGFPAAPTRSHYWITAPDGNGVPDRPNVQLPELRAYLRSEIGGLVVGLQEPRSRTFDPDGLAPDMADILLHEEGGDLDLLVEQAGQLRQVVPGIDSWRFAHHIAGLSMYTPDGKFVLGRPDGFSNLIVAGGCCGSGLAASGGYGEAVAELVTGRDTTNDLTRFHPSRFGAVDPRSREFQDRCSAARAGKGRGRPDPVPAQSAA